MAKSSTADLDHQMLGKLAAFVDKAQDKAVGYMVETLHPKVHSVIDTRVDSFRDTTLDTIPRQCEDGLKAKSESSTVAWLVDKVGVECPAAAHIG